MAKFTEESTFIEVLETTERMEIASLFNTKMIYLNNTIEIDHLINHKI